VLQRKFAENVSRVVRVTDKAYQLIEKLEQNDGFKIKCARYGDLVYEALKCYERDLESRSKKEK
jgi:hypothetical protein